MFLFCIMTLGFVDNPADAAVRTESRVRSRRFFAAPCSPMNPTKYLSIENCVIEIPRVVGWACFGMTESVHSAV